MCSLKRILALPIIFAVWSNRALAGNLLPEKNFACSEPANLLLRERVSHPEWRPVVYVGGHRYKTPTDATGVWVDLTITAVGFRLERRFPERVETLWAERPDCKISRMEIKYSLRPVKHIQRFTDLDLRQKLDESRRKSTSGIFYFWSPHMNYSIRGLNELRAAGQSKGLTIIGILDSNADRNAAIQVAKRNHFSPDDLRTLDSVDLLERGPQNHFPSMIIFKNGRVVSPTIPGYNLPEKLDKILGEFLKG